MTVPDDLLSRYAGLLIRIGVNLQPGQSLNLTCELEHRSFVALIVEAAYRAGARYVQLNWIDPPSAKARYLHSHPDYLEFFPEYEVTRHRQMVDESWARLSLVGAEFPDIFDDVDPGAMRHVSQTRAQRLKFYSQAMMANRMQWCVAAVPTRAWAQQVYPGLPADQALGTLWNQVLRMCRVDQPDPVAAWQQHDRALRRVSQYLAQHQVRALRFLDPVPAPDGAPRTDLTIGLTDRPQWVAASSRTPAGVQFLANMPTEEVFSTPHSGRTEGWVRTSKPTFPFERKVDDAYFRFERGELVEFSAAVGQGVLDQFFQIPGTRRLGEVSLVDDRSPINQAGVTFHEILFDENAVCHIAFGKAYPEGMEGADQLSEEELQAAGVNEADAHLDVMIGSSTMTVTGLGADGTEAPVMANGRFVAAVVGEEAA